MLYRSDRGNCVLDMGFKRETLTVGFCQEDYVQTRFCFPPKIVYLKLTLYTVSPVSNVGFRAIF